MIVERDGFELVERGQRGAVDPDAAVGAAPASSGEPLRLVDAPVAALLGS